MQTNDFKTTLLFPPFSSLWYINAEYYSVPQIFVGSQDHAKWQTVQNCKIFLWIYFSLVKYVPALLIVGINVVIAWKMRGIAKARREIHRDEASTDFSLFTGTENISR